MSATTTDSIVATTTTNTSFNNCSNTINCSLTSDEVIWKPAVIQRVATIVFSMTLAFIGNTAIIILLTCSRYRKRNSRVNIFIIHLAIGDLTVCICTMTTEILFVAFNQWVLGPALCKILPYLQCITLASTTFILTSMSFDRYLAISKPLKYRATTAKAKKFIAISWALATILAIPQLLIFVQIQEIKTGKVKLMCKTRGYTAEWQRMLYVSFLTCYVFVIPMILITFCYISIVCAVSNASRVVQNKQNNNWTLRRSECSRGKSTFPRAKIKTLKMTFTIIATFVICWTPYFVTTLIRVYSNYKVPVPDSVMAIAETTTFIQSAFNPLIYGCFNFKFKRGIKELFFRRSSSYHSGGLSMSGISTNTIRKKQVYEVRLLGNSKIRESAATNNVTNSDSRNSLDQLDRGSMVTAVTEENKNGIRLRVRFASKDTCKCTPADGLDHSPSEISVSYDILQPSPSPILKMTIPKHNSLQQLYK